MRQSQFSNKASIRINRLMVAKLKCFTLEIFFLDLQHEILLIFLSVIGPLAQPAERGANNAKVMGSIPIPTNFC